MVHKKHGPQLTVKAAQYIRDRIYNQAPLLSVDLSENDWVNNSGREHRALDVRKKASLALVRISENEKSSNADHENQESEDLPEGHKAK